MNNLGMAVKAIINSPPWITITIIITVFLTHYMKGGCNLVCWVSYSGIPNRLSLTLSLYLSNLILFYKSMWRTISLGFPGLPLG